MISLFIYTINTMVDKLEELQRDLLDIIFDNKTQQNFMKNKPISVEYFKVFLENVEDTFMIRNDTIIYKKDTLSRVLSQDSVTPSGLYNIVRNIMLGKTKNNVNEKYSYISPILLLMFYQNLENDGFEFVKTISGYYEIRHNSSDTIVNRKIMETFKIFIKLFEDDNINCILPQIRKRIVLNFITGKKLENLPYRYCDIFCRISQKQIIMINIDIKEMKECDILEKDSIIMNTFDSILLHYNVDRDTDIFIKTLYKEIAKKVYYEFNVDAIAFYLTLKNIDSTYCKFFANVYENKKNYILLKDVVDFLKMNSFKDPIKVIINAINNGDMEIDDFSHEHMEAVIDALGRITKKKFPKIKLTTKGFHTMLTYFRNSDWEYASKVKNYFAEFTEGYFEFIKDFLSNSYDEKKYMKNAIRQLKDFHTVHRLLKLSMLKHLEDKIKIKREKEDLNIDIHSTIPLLVKEEGMKVPRKNLIEKLYGLNLKFGQDLKDHPDYNSNIYNDIKYRIDMLESKEFIENYRIINEKELKSLI